MKLISWNVNGFRACLQKGFAEFFTQVDADIFCLQETKMQEGQANFNPEGYFAYYNSAIKKGYSGTAVFSKQQPLQVTLGINDQYNDEESNNSEHIDTLLQCSKLLETLDDNGIKKIK